MNIFLMGGWMMWPLALVSMAALAIIIERILFFSSFSFPGRDFPSLLEKASGGDVQPLLESMRKETLLRRLAGLLGSAQGVSESALRAECATVSASLEKRLSMLALLAKLAPLMGLLGTIFGMIATFSEIASATSGINMNQLAGGIWQALVTTAAGLCIAIPALFFLHLFQKRVDRITSALSESADMALSIRAGRQA